MTEPTRALLDAGELRPSGTVVVLLSSAVDRRWAADAAIELSALWAAQGRRIVLADLHLENPVLHLGLDVSNLEGVVDIFLYGASLARIARPVRNGAFYLIPAGTYAPDLQEVYRHPRWRKLVAGFKETDATLLLFVPADTADLEALSSWASEAILLGSGTDAEVRAKLDKASIRLLGVVEPEPSAAAPAADAELLIPEAAALAADPWVGAEIAEMALEEPPAAAPPSETAAQRRRDLSPPVQVHRPPESELELPPPPVRRRRERHTSSILLWGLFVLILLGTIGYLVATIRPDLVERFLGTSIAPVSAASEAPPPAPAPARRLGELLPYSIHVRAFPSLAAAREELPADQARLETVPFFISPEAIQGIVYYRILSGLATDTTSAIALRDRLVEIGAVDEEDAVGPWSLVQFTPLSFDLGEYPTEAAARARADSLIAAEIPTYTAAVDYSDGSRRWQLYAGAYADSASASAMRDILGTAGIEATLSARNGVPAILPE